MNDEVLRQRAKQMMRKRFRAARRAVPAAAREKRSESICERLAQHAAVKSAQTVALFFPILRLGEVDLRAFDEHLRAEGRKVAYPRMQGPAPAMDFAWVNDLKELEDRGHGFWEPPSDAEAASSLQLIVVPGLAFDARGNRLGYGGGCYDKILAEHDGALSIGVAFDFQLASDLPAQSQDVAVQCIVTDKKVLELSTTGDSETGT